MKRFFKRFTTENGKVSGTKTLFSLFAFFVCLKYLAANISIGTFAIGGFDGVGAAAILAALGATYGGRRFTESLNANQGGNADG